MRLKTRVTHAFIEIKADEIETTVYKSDKNDVDDMIDNLLDVVNDLSKFSNKKVNESKAAEMLEMLKELINLHDLGHEIGQYDKARQLIKEATEL